jgi:putative ABC transport system permease protein
MMDGMLGSIEQVVQLFETGSVSVVSKEYEADREYMPVQYPVAGGRDAAELAKEIAAIPGVAAAFPRISAYATLQDSTKKHALLWGIKIDEENAAHHFNLTKKTDGLVEGRFPAPDANECAVGTKFAEKTGLKIGDKIPLKTVSAQFSDKMWNPVITGIFEFDFMKYDEDAIVVDFGRLERLLVLGGATQQMFAFAENPADSAHIAAAIRNIAGPDDLVRDWRDNYVIVLMRQSMAIFYVIDLVFLIVASFLIINTVVMIIHERIKEIGMMGSLGMTRREIVLVFFLEAVFISIAGSLAGAALGGIATFIGSLFPLDFTAMMGGGFKDYPTTGTLFLKFSPGILAMGFFFGIIVSSICTLVPSLKSAFVEPVEALRR